MAMFMAHIASILEIAAVAAGLVALYYAAQLHTKLIKAAGIVLVAAGIIGLTCTWYYAFKYYFHGDFERPYGFHMKMEGMSPADHGSGTTGN